jgi:hypothetical protein
MSEITINQVEVQKLELQDGDILVVKVPPKYSTEQCTFIQKTVAAAVARTGMRVPVLLGASDVQFAIIRKEVA